MHPLAKLASDNLHINRQLYFDFFTIYSRFEYALKDQNHVEKSISEIRLRTSYSDLAKKIEGPFQKLVASDTALKEAVDYYLLTPPKKQIWDGTKPDWRTDQLTEHGIHRLLIYLAHTRNNLFHGGKGFSRESNEIYRDTKLLTHGIRIIGAVLECDRDLKESFSSFQ